MRISSRFVAPWSWVFAIVCVGGTVPVLKLPYPIYATVAYTLLLLGTFFAGAALADFAGTASGSRLLTLTGAGGAAAALGAWFAGIRHVPLLPSVLVLEAGRGEVWAVLFAAVLAVTGAGCSFLALPWMLRHSPPEQRPNQRGSAAVMTPFRRELRVESKLTEIRTAWVIDAALCFYLATADRPEPDALRIMFGLIAFLTIAAAMNSFALDGVAGLDRFLLWPTGSARILADKNKAFAVVVMAPALVLAALTLWRFGWHEGVADFLEAAAITLATLAWGNISSVRHPENAANIQGGNILDQLVGMAAIAIPTAVAVSLLRGSPKATPLYLLGLAGACLLAYAASLRWSARYVARRHEQIRQALS